MKAVNEYILILLLMCNMINHMRALRVDKEYM